MKGRRWSGNKHRLFSWLCKYITSKALWESSTSGHLLTNTFRERGTHTCTRGKLSHSHHNFHARCYNRRAGCMNQPRLERNVSSIHNPGNINEHSRNAPTRRARAEKRRKSERREKRKSFRAFQLFSCTLSSCENSALLACDPHTQGLEERKKRKSKVEIEKFSFIHNQW